MKIIYGGGRGGRGGRGGGEKRGVFWEHPKRPIEYLLLTKVKWKFGKGFEISTGETQKIKQHYKKVDLRVVVVFLIREPV